MTERIKYLSIALFVILLSGLFITVIIPHGIIWLFELGTFERFNMYCYYYIASLIITGILGLIIPDNN